MLIVEERHYDVRRLEQKRPGICGGVGSGDRDGDCRDSVRANGVRNRFRHAPQRVEVACGHSLEVDDDTAVPGGVYHRCYRSGCERGGLLTTAESANDLGMEAASFVGGDQRHCSPGERRIDRAGIVIQANWPEAQGVERNPARYDTGELL